MTTADIEQDELQQPVGDSMSRGLVASFGVSAAVQLTNVVTGVLLARHLGPEGRGELTTILLWASILATIGQLGVEQSTTYHTARRAAPLGTLIGTALALAAVQSVVLIGLGLAILPAILSSQEQVVQSYGVLYLLSIPLNLTAVYLLAVLNGLQRFVGYHLLRFVVTLVNALIIVGATVSGNLTVQLAVVSSLIANFVLMAWVAVAVSRVRDSALRVRRSLLRSVLGFGVRSHTSSVPVLLNERLDQLLISIFLSPFRLGIYAVAVTLNSLTSLVGASVQMVALPAVARLPPGEERTRRARMLVALTLITATCLTVPLIALADVVIELFFGPAFSDSVPIARILLVAGVILSTNRTLEGILQAVGRPLDAGIAEGVALIVTLAALAVLLPTLGLTGAAIASLLAYSVALAWMTGRAAHALDTDRWHLLVPGRGTIALFRQTVAGAMRRGG